MDCSEVREILLARELGLLDDDEAAEFDEHAASCESCGALVEAGDKAHQMLRAWRSATDELFDPSQIDEALAEFAALTERRSARAGSPRRAREEAAGPETGSKAPLVIIGVVAVVGIAAAAYFMLRPPRSPARSDPIFAVLPAVTDSASARDVACILDVQIIDQLTLGSASEAKLAARLWARALARREGFAASPAFVRAILGGTGEGGVDSSAASDPLRLAGELELAGLAAWAEEECARVAASATDEKVKRRAKLHLAAALLRQGKLDEAEGIITEIAPPVVAPSADAEAPAEAPEETDAETDAEGEAPAEEAPRDFIATLADVLAEEVADARTARADLETRERTRPKYADDRGGKIAIDAFLFDRAYELFEGEDPVHIAPLTGGWARLMQGDVDEARVVLLGVAAVGRRYYRSMSYLGLAEIAFRQGRYMTGFARLLNAKQERRNPEITTRFLKVVALAQGMREFLDGGSAPAARRAFDEDNLSSLKVREGMLRLVDGHLRPRIEPLVQAREAVTSTWPKVKRMFDQFVDPPAPGTVSGPKDVTNVVKLDFELGASKLAPAGGDTNIGDAEGCKGRGAKVESAGALAAARLTFEAPVPEVETWVACAVKLGCPGEFCLRAKEAASGAVFRWRTFVLSPGRWHRLAVPLGAFEPEEPGGRDASLLMKKIESVDFSFRPWAGRGPAAVNAGLQSGANTPGPAAFILDDVLVHHGEPPEGTDTSPRPPRVPVKPEAADPAAPSDSPPAIQ